MRAHPTADSMLHMILSHTSMLTGAGPKIPRPVRMQTWRLGVPSSSLLGPQVTSKLIISVSVLRDDSQGLARRVACTSFLTASTYTLADEHLSELDFARPDRGQ